MNMSDSVSFETKTKTTLLVYIIAQQQYVTLQPASGWSMWSSPVARESLDVWWQHSRHFCSEAVPSSSLESFSSLVPSFPSNALLQVASHCTDPQFATHWLASALKTCSLFRLPCDVGEQVKPLDSTFCSVRQSNTWKLLKTDEASHLILWIHMKT